MNIYLDLFCTFARIGAFTFGGGYAMLPLIQREVVEKKHWASEDEVMDYYAVGQCTPGVIAVNTATFIGYYQKGILGGICATLGVITPSIIIILTIANLLTAFSTYPIVQHALGGIRIGVCILMLNALIKLFKNGIKDLYGLLIFALAFIATYFNLLSTIIIVICAAIIGITIKHFTQKGGAQS